MPHFVIEYSANLDARLDVSALCGRIRDTIMASGLFELGAIRVRAYRADAYAITDGLADNAFIDMSFRIGAGRSEQDKKRVGQAIFDVVAQDVASLFDTPHFALSLEIREIDAALSWKKNAMHARLRAAAQA